jgi:thiamine biosynthesis lipoprotein
VEQAAPGAEPGPLVDPVAADEPVIAVRSLRAIGTTAVIAVTAPELADAAVDRLAGELRAIDEACSRFREDSELRTVERTGGGLPVPVSPLLFEALEVAVSVAVLTGGIVDPTIGSALVRLGYDRDFDEVGELTSHPDVEPAPAPGWWQLVLDAEAGTVAIPDGVHVDLGSSAKAFAADRAAQHIAALLGCGVLVSLGGDLAVSGPAPAGGWAIGIAATASDEVEQVVAIAAGGVASSGTTARSWVRNGRTVHHIIDPWTGEAADPVWSLVSTTGRTCVEANAWSTAAVVWGEDAPGNLAGHGVAARLVRCDGAVVHVGGWPQESAPVTDAGTDPASERKVP